MNDGSQPVSMPLTPEQLRRRCDPSRLKFKNTSQIKELTGLVAQKRALDAVKFAISIKERGYNLFVIGPAGSGKHIAVSDFLKLVQHDRPVPSDWIYVYNFETPHRPMTIELPPGRGLSLSGAMDRLIEDLRVALPSFFEGKEYQSQTEAVDTAMRNRQERALEELSTEASLQNVAMVKTTQGVTMVPAPSGNILKPEEFKALPESMQNSYEAKLTELQAKLAEIMKLVPRWQKESRDQVRALNREVAGIVVDEAVDEVKLAFAEIPAVSQYLDTVRADLVENAQLFMTQDDDPSPFREPGGDDGRFERYRINVLVDRTHDDGRLPVVVVDNPTFGNLIGRIEYLQQQGALVTNFRLIKAGSLHRANGGYILIDMREIVSEPFAWKALKRALRCNAIKFENPNDQGSAIHTVSLEPDPIPLDVKVVVFGDRGLFYNLSQIDSDIADLFKVIADFDDTADWNDNTEDLYAGLIASVVAREELRPLDASAVALAIERAAREADDAKKLSTKVGPLADILRESSHWARMDGMDTVTSAHLQRALDERINRADRIRKNAQEMILRDITMIDTSGEEVGQINGLAVLSMGEGSFGRASRITARVRVGTGTVMDIEREVTLGGPLHTKGVLILAGFLQSRYALDEPISLAASLVFEQSYGEVDGDSASSTELYALLSALSDVPIRQSVAVTGSVNQRGEIQAIGGVNYKIEGFFDICVERGLTGEQGVMIPQSNVQHLMLRQDVVDACRAGEFRVWGVANIDQGIEILTGRFGGVRGDDGRFTQNSINRLVEDKLSKFALIRRSFMSGASASGFSGVSV